MLKTVRAGVLGLLTALAALCPTVDRARAETALDRYVAAPDPNYRYALASTIPGNGFTAYVLQMISQQWRSAAEVDRPFWKHWLVVIEPAQATTRTGVLVIGGGKTDSKPPQQANPLLALLAVTTHSVVSELHAVPNEPLTFAGEATSRSEDAITAYTWDRYLRTGDDTWPIRLPMTKAAVRAMDTVTTFCANLSDGRAVVDRFVVGGASKRGWTAWTTAAVDKRVVAIVPMVIDMLNLEPSLEHHYRAYGFWAPALGDYQEMGIMRWRGTPQLRQLLAIEDPYSYRDRLTMPKLIVNSTGDQYFLPDSWQFYLPGLQGETYLRYVPNTDHGLRSIDTATTALAFYQSILNGTPRPKFSWRFAEDGAIEVKTETPPTEVRLWQATNPTARDFRLQTIGPAFKSSALADQGDGTFIGTVSQPAQGWVAYFVEMTFPNGSDYPFTFTTGVRVTPDTLPFALPAGGAPEAQAGAP